MNESFSLNLVISKLLELRFRALFMLSKHSTTEHHYQSANSFYSMRRGNMQNFGITESIRARTTKEKTGFQLSQKEFSP